MLPALQRSPKDTRDWKFSGSPGPLPYAVDLRSGVSPIENQGAEGACTAHATTTGLEVFSANGGAYEALSRRFLMYTTLEFEGRIGQEGAVLRDCLKVASKTGVCLESELAYVARQGMGIKPSQACYDSAAFRKVTGYAGITLSQSNLWDTVDNLKRALADGMPVIIAMAVYRPILDVKGPLHLQNYQSYEPVTHQMYEYIGNHAVVIVGYDDAISSFIIANSWGTEWGDEGFGALRYRMSLDIFEAWVVLGFNELDILKPLPQGAVMPLTIKMSGTANAAGEIIFAHGIPDMGARFITASCMYQDPNWAGVMRPMTLIYQDVGGLRFEGATANAVCHCSFTYAD